MPEITTDIRRVLTLIVLTLLIAFMFAVWIFAFYM